MIELTLKGKPIPYQAPTFTSSPFKNSKKYAYDKLKSTKQAKKWEIISELQKLDTEPTPLQTAIEIHLEFCFLPPESLSKKKKTLLKNTPHTKKPDLDNLIKFTLDVLKGIVFKDDNQVFMIRARKYYEVEDKTLIKIFSL